MAGSRLGKHIFLQMSLKFLTGVFILIILLSSEVKLEPDSAGQSCSSLVSQDGQVTVKAEESSELGNYVIG